MKAAGPRAARRRGRLVVLGIFAVCAAPVLGALAAYYFFPPTGRVNYGELIEPQPLPRARLVRLDGSAFALDELKGKWVLLQADRAECTAACRTKLFNMRQVRLAQGEQMARVARVWLLLDGGRPPPELARLYEGATLAYGGAAVAAALPAADARNHVFLVDPRGQVMMRYPEDADPKRMIKDLERLLKYSAIG